MSQGRGRPWLGKRLRPAQKQQPVNFMEETLLKRPQNWIKHFGRFAPRLILYLSRRIPFREVRKHKLRPREKVAIFISRMVTGEAYKGLGSRWGISHRTVRKIFFDVLRKLIHLFKKLIKLPTVREMAEIRRLMEEREDDLMMALFIIDGTHTPSPILCDETY